MRRYTPVTTNCSVGQQTKFFLRPQHFKFCKIVPVLRLCDVCRVRGSQNYNYMVLSAEVQQRYSHVGPVTVKDQNYGQCFRRFWDNIRQNILLHKTQHRVISTCGPPCTIRFGPREAGDGEMRQGATGRRQGGGRKTTGWRQEDDRPAAGKRQGSDRKRQAGDRKATGEVRQEGDRRATGRRQGGDRETTGKRHETRHSDRISDRKATGRRQEGNRASGDREATGKRQEKATGERQESDRRATGERQGVFLRQEGDRKATRRRQGCDRRATGLWKITSGTT